MKLRNCKEPSKISDARYLLFLQPNSWHEYWLLNFPPFYFAFRVTKEVEKDSKEAKQYIKQQEKNDEAKVSAQKRPGGLGSIMGVISGKAPKMGCLDKSKMDWNKFVEDEGIKEDLQSHNRGKDG